MIRATTPTHKFILPFDCAEYIKELLITYAQLGGNVLEKTQDDVTYDGDTISFTLSQEETNLFKANYDVEIQIRVLTKNNDAMASQIYTIPVMKVLNDEVL